MGFDGSTIFDEVRTNELITDGPVVTSGIELETEDGLDTAFISDNKDPVFSGEVAGTGASVGAGVGSNVCALEEEGFIEELPDD